MIYDAIMKDKHLKRELEKIKAELNSLIHKDQKTIADSYFCNLYKNMLKNIECLESMVLDDCICDNDGQGCPACNSARERLIELCQYWYN